MLVLRLLVLLLAGFTLFSDEQERFICNTIQPGCSNVCFDVFAPVSVLRLWLFQLILLCLLHVLFATYVMHKVVAYPSAGAFYYDRSQGGSPVSLENSSSSREIFMHKAPLRDLPCDWAAPRFYCAYLQVVILRILLEVVFGAGQFFLFGLSVPKSFLCYEAPCTSGVECYISRPTEKTMMLGFMLGVATLSILMSLVDLVSSIKAMVTWRRKREMLMEEMSKGDQSSMFTTSTMPEDSNVVFTRTISLSGNSKNGFKDEKRAAAGVVPNDDSPQTKVNGGAIIKTRESDKIKDPTVDVTSTPMGTPVPTHFVLHSHLRPSPSPRPDRGPPPNPRLPTTMGVNKPGQYSPVGATTGQQSDSSDSQDKRAWV